MFKTRISFSLCGPGVPEGPLVKRLLMPYRLMAGDCCTAGSEAEYQFVVVGSGFFDLPTEEWCVTVQLGLGTIVMEGDAEFFIGRLYLTLIAQGWEVPELGPGLEPSERLLEGIASVRLIKCVKWARPNGTGPGGRPTLGDLGALGGQLGLVRGVGKTTILEAEALCQRYGVPFGPG